MFAESYIYNKQNCIFGLLQGIDIFGVGISIRFNQQSKHKTGFGGLITLILGGLLFVLLVQSILSIINKSNPHVIFQQDFVSNPSRYNLTNENFSFAITLLDSQFNPIYDKSIFRIEGNFLYKEPQLNTDGSESTSIFKNKVIEFELCTTQSFQVKGTESYFLSLDYQSMYCFKDINDYYLVGQFEMEEFSVIQINVIPCDQSDPNNQVQCMEESKKNNILSHAQLQVYYINQVVQVESQQQPFKPMGITYFWESNIDFLQNINLMFMKTYIQDDIGVIFENNVQNSSLLFSRERTTMSSKKDLSIYQLSLYLEKNKEQTYSRKYQKIFDCFSSIGGIYNVLFAIGCIIAQPYSQIQLNRKLFNSTFQVNTNDGNNQLNDSQSIIKSNTKKNNSKKEEAEIQNDLKNNNDKFQIDKLEKANQFFKGSQIDEIIEDNESSKSVLDLFKQQFNVIKIQTREYLSQYFSCFKSQMRELINFGTKQIFGYTDICFIVNKLIELEKLKAILLNEEQIKLFDFIPKPSINHQFMRQFGKRDNKVGRCLKNDPKMQTQKNEQKYQRNQECVQNQILNKQFNILSVQNKSNYEKARQAQQAFNNIYRNKQKQSKIDMKLIQLLNQDLIELFDNNIFSQNNLAGSVYLFNSSISRTRQKIDQSPIFNQQNRFSKQFFNKNFKKFNKTLNFSQEFQYENDCEVDFFESIHEAQFNEITEADQIIQNYQPQRKNFISYTQQKNQVFQNDFQLKKQLSNKQ
ncbi:ubiquitin-conjugating enzyme family protein (macronuclear) [Tetrahymena thermophila SB210]|uniref:Ubiquitin-conjugating enzyme family protein n=1 Tax=Tetrahymena thermophila (strain SB210) TaxID=312017 RepID=Q24CX2_TETTS|nr:ubiquitin-conjugating enzyme family protein [Tetrahymena thermophila SB210]EAS05636.2 ubiquitin-conjugating enzyme family protein [Tetrahymena thermophila SB210]|eukprot:XP_001025881.2 ubiquitin-conjugating enzyme family protein [Tetrahymena thermophila SB210]